MLILALRIELPPPDSLSCPVLASPIGQGLATFGDSSFVYVFTLAECQLALHWPRLVLLHFEGPACDPAPVFGGRVGEGEVCLLVQLSLGNVDRTLAQILYRWKRVLLDPQPGAQLLDTHRECPQLLFGFAHLIAAIRLTTLFPKN